MAYTTINKPQDHFNTKLYSGNGSTNAITGVGFQPDFIWIKGRSGTYATENHNVYDSTRGTTKFLIPNGTTASTTDANSLTAFGTDGFTLGVRGDVNGASTEYLSYNWKANGGTTSSNTDGSITSTVQANTTAGFSIVSYTGNLTDGATVGHGLSTAPDVIIFKNLSDTQYWVVYHKDLGGANNHLRLDSNAAKRNDLNMFSSTAPTSSVFELGNKEQVNGSGNSMIAYCFAPIKGYSKFGTYTGAGAGAFIYTGFKPAWVMWKKTALENWGVSNSVVDTFNQVDKRIRPDGSNAELSSTAVDFLSNGFKFRSTSGEWNASGSTYIYMAFAEAPVVGTNNVPATAR
jgi:hypothetical protein